MSNSIDPTPLPSPDATPQAVVPPIDESDIQALVRLEDVEGSQHALTAFKLKVKSTGNPYLLAHLLSHLGHLQLRKRAFEQARETLNEADFVLIEAAKHDHHESPHRHRAWLRYMLERSRYFFETGWEKSGRDMLDETLEMARATGHFDLFQESLQLKKSVEVL